MLPTSQDLERGLKALLEDVPTEERELWLEHPMTQGLAVLFESMRMRCFEEIEAGAPAEKLAGQASICSDAVEMIRAGLSPDDETEEVAHDEY
jgi:hypothetical protein